VLGLLVLRKASAAAAALLVEGRRLVTSWRMIMVMNRGWGCKSRGGCLMKVRWWLARKLNWRLAVVVMR
jgi:hypothetical protein